MPARRAAPAATRPPTVEIRPATRADVPALGALGAKLARAHHGFDPARFFVPEGRVEDGYAGWLGKELASRRAVLLAAAVRGRVVGYAYGRIEGRDWNLLRDRCGVAIDLWVEPAARRAGAGTRLVEALAAALEAKGAPRVVLYVATGNPGAERLFRALGFRPTMLEMAREAGRGPAVRAPSPPRAPARRRRAASPRARARRTGP